jgi:hypothetical protein
MLAMAPMIPRSQAPELQKQQYSVDRNVAINASNYDRNNRWRRTFPNQGTWADARLFWSLDSKLSILLAGESGFEPPTPWSRTRSTQLLESV